MCASEEWAMKYAKRWSVEQLFSGWKNPGRPEQHCYIGLAKIRLHVLLQVLVSLAEATAKIILPVQLRLFQLSPRVI